MCFNFGWFGDSKGWERSQGLGAINIFHLCTTSNPVLPRGPRGLCLNWPLLWASWMAFRSAGMCSPKRRRRLDRLLSKVCRFLLLLSMDLWSISFSLLKVEGGRCFRYVRGCCCPSYSTAVCILQTNKSSPNWIYLAQEVYNLQRSLTFIFNLGCSTHQCFVTLLLTRGLDLPGPKDLEHLILLNLWTGCEVELSMNIVNSNTYSNS